MATFNTYDYEFLLKCLSEGSIIFKAEAIKRLNTLAGADKKQFVNHLRLVMNQLQTLYKQDKQEVNYHSIMLLNEIISNVQSKQLQNLLYNKHLPLIMPALGHHTKTSLRKAAHTVILNSIKSYPLFPQLVNIYIKYGFESEIQLVAQKSINSFQSIFILEVRNFDWLHETSISLLETLIDKIQHDSLFVSKAASQCVLSICKMEPIKKLVSKIHPESIKKLKKFMQEIVLKMSADTFLITPIELQSYINSNKVLKENAVQSKPKNKKVSSSSSDEEIEEKISPNKNNSNNHRRLEKIKKAIKNEEKKVEKQNHGAKLFSFITGEGTLKERTQAMQDLLYKIQVSKTKPEFQSSMKAIFPTLIKMLKDNNPKIVSLTLRIIQNCIEWIAGNENQLNNIVSVIVQKLGDQKISIRQNVSKVIKELANKTSKGIWIRELMDNLKKNTSNALKDETLYLVHYIYENCPREEEIHYPTAQLIEEISKFTDDPKTKIKIRTLDCLSVIVFHSKQPERYNFTLKGKMSSVFYQMYLQKLGKLDEQIDKKNQDIQKKVKKEQMQKMSQQTYRTIYRQNRNDARSQGQNEQTLNVSMEVVKKRVSSLRKPRNLLSTQETISLDSSNAKNNDKSMEDIEIVLPSLYKKTGNKFISTKKCDFAPNKTNENKQSDYLTKDDLKPLRDPEKEMKNLMIEMKSSDWKIQFQSINKLRRLIEFNPNIILESSSANIHSLVLDMLSLVQNLRSSVAKNSLICMGEFIVIMGKQIDLQMQIVLEKLVKKSADTNVFISSEVQKCLNILATNCTSNKFLQKLAAYRESKSVSVKQAIVSTLLVMKNTDKIRQKQYGKLAESLAFYIQDSQLQVRSKAKLGVVQLSRELGDWYRALRGKINPIYFKSICELMTKSPSLKKQEGNNYVNNTINVSSLQNKSNNETKSIAYEEKPIRQTMQPPLKKKYVKIAQFPAEFNEIQGILESSNSPDWKKKIECLNKIKEIALEYPNEFVQFRSSTHFIDCLCKQISEPNVKVCLNASNTLFQIFDPLRSIVESNLGIICNSVFGGLSSNKTQVKQVLQKCTITLLQNVELNLLMSFFCQGILYSLPRSRVYLLNQLIQRIQMIHDQKKQLLHKNVFPLLNKLMDEYKTEMMPHVIVLFQKLYDIMGNAMFGHISKFKEVRQLIDK